MVATLTPAETAQKMLNLAIEKQRQHFVVVFFKAFVAGVFLSTGGLLNVIVAGGSPSLNADNPGLVKLLAALVFPVGLVMIVLQGQELLTSNMMTVPMLIMKRAIPWWGLGVNWTIVFFGNLTGSLFFAGVLTKASGIISAAPYPAYIRTFTHHKAIDPAWHQIFLRGIGCNWFVCIAVWQAMAAKDVSSKILAIWIPITVFVCCGFDHVVANMFFIPLGIMFDADFTVADYIRKSLIASFLGNVVGGLLVAIPFTLFYNPIYDADVENVKGGDLEKAGISDVSVGSARTE